MGRHDIGVPGAEGYVSVSGYVSDVGAVGRECGGRRAGDEEVRGEDGGRGAVG